MVFLDWELFQEESRNPVKDTLRKGMSSWFGGLEWLAQKKRLGGLCVGGIL